MNWTHTLTHLTLTRAEQNGLDCFSPSILPRLFRYEPELLFHSTTEVADAIKHWQHRRLL